MEGLAPIETWAILAILAKAAGYIAALLAMGGVVFVALFRDVPADVIRLARRIAALAAVVGLLILAARFGIRAARLSGMGLEGAVDPLMLGLIWDSPLGAAAVWRAGGEALILTVLFARGFWLIPALIGAIMVAYSFTLVGHSLGEPRMLLGSLLAVHVVMVAFWVGALGPLHRAARTQSGAALLHRFGMLASIGIPVLIVAGGIFAWLMIGSFTGLFGTAYGWAMLGKIVVVAGLLALAAANKLKLVPALARGDAGAARRLRTSIRLECAAVVGIALLTATMTSVTVPPANL
ncbi:CopD family protein [Pontivivens insulae]|uniref:Copper resistance protein D domain-containing protein n=1 Tax=Pontivivens insulae TaxID=1639689 RepID=A0A2R8AFX5_9RHOB|nr:CopD family protein [Pontivivens insulae]RED10628.1 putative copper resistance protein D [Pontivivens insulae]SPF31162.1 hypothetical protein POI8812_03513 [Pontivivens insulae]